MAKTVGLSRNLKIMWLNKAAEMYGEALTEDEYRDRLNEYLSFEIKSDTNLRKTREILMRVWYYEDEAISPIREDAYALIKKYPEYDIAIHWCMLLAVYPVFADISKLMGRIAEFNDIITLSILKQKLYDEWGERTTLFHSTDKIISTMKDFNVISSNKPGNYTVIKHTISKNDISVFMIHIAMKVDGNTYYSYTDLTMFDVLFPFEYNISKESLMEDEKVVVTNFGGELSVTLKAE